MSVYMSLNVFHLWFKVGKEPAIITVKKKKKYSKHTNRMIKHKELLYLSRSLVLWAVLEPGTENNVSISHWKHNVYSENSAVTLMHNKHTVKHTLYQLQMYSDCKTVDTCSNYEVNSPLTVRFKWMVFSSIPMKITAGHVYSSTPYKATRGI